MSHLSRYCLLRPNLALLTLSARTVPSRSYSDVLDGGEGKEKPDIFKPSIVPTDHFQDSLPRLAVPPLEKTCERYLASQRPLLNDQEYKRTEEIVNKFRDGEGKALHEQLVAIDKANSHTSYVTDHWFDMYLKDRRPVVINQNPFMIMQNDSRQAYNQPLYRITNIIVSSARFRRAFLDKTLEPEVFHLDPKKSDTLTFRRVTRMLPRAISWYGAYMFNAYPLDMSQYGKLFNSTRKPRKERDDLFTDLKGRHVLLQRKGNFYAINVLDESGSLLPESDILADVKYVLEHPAPPSDYPLGILTTEGRDRWAQLRNALIASGNTDSLRTIDSAMFVISYDDEPSSGFSQNATTFLHSDGTNRWFDKSFSVVMLGDGVTGINFEHSWGDGVAVLRYFNDVFKDSTQNARVAPGRAPSNVNSASRVKKVEFQLTDELKSAITEARNKFKQTATSVQFQYLLYEQLSKEFFKKKQIYPDGMMQFSFQLAYHKLHGGTAATYESSSTAAFKHGRTETIRSATMATKTACELFEGKQKASKEALLAALKECSNQHANLTKEAAMGKGFDRHLFVLRIMAQQRGKELPEIFRDPAYTKINHNILSTSTLTSPALMFGGFGPVVPDGYGIGYGVFDNFVGCNVSAFKDKRNVGDFVESIRKSLDQIAEVLS